MKITNITGLPLPLVRAIENDPYDRGDADISVTQLIQPPRKIELERRHADEISEDASSRIFALLGQSIHVILERAGCSEITERRLFAKHLGWTVSGAVDLWKSTVIHDYKLTSTWSALRGPKQEWIEQLNLLAWLCGIYCIKVMSLQIICIFRDWSKMEAARNRDYPQQQVMTYDIPLWDLNRQVTFAEKRIRLHQAARAGELPECTDEERWAKPTQWAVRKRANKRATAVFDTLKEAEQRRGGNVNMVLEERPSEWTRCEHYCSVGINGFCDQFNKIKEAGREAMDCTPAASEDSARPVSESTA